MANYQRQLGQNDVYDMSGAQPRYISFDEAQKNNIWGQVQDVSARTLDNRSPSAGAETSLTFDRGTQPDSYSIFNNALMEMLKKYQSIGSKPMRQQSLDLSTQQAQRGMVEATPGMSPAQQNLIRSSSQQALNPSIQGAEDTSRTFSEQMGGFKDVLNTVQQTAAQMQDAQFKTQENTRKMIETAITQFGSTAFEGVNENELKALEKSAGYPSGYLMRAAKSLKEQELATKNQKNYASGVVGEYQFYAEQEQAVGRKPMTFNEYSNLDANRKRAVNNTYIGGSGMTAGQISTFNSIVDKYNKSPLVAAADRTVILDNSIANVEKDPGNAAMQLNLSYSYIQALDTYQSAVREGELSNLNTIDSKIGGIQGYLQQIQNGQIVRPEVALQIAKAAKEIVSTIKMAANQKKTQFGAQAKTAGVGEAWNNYQSEMNNSTPQNNNQVNSTEKATPEDVTQTFESHKGSDGYVSPSDWQTVKAMYGNDSEFEKLFSKFKNPKDNY